MPPQTPPVALATVLDYHQRTKHRFEGYAPGPGTLDWDAQPAPFRHFDGAAQIALPRLSAVPPGSALHAALTRPFAALDDPRQAPLPPDLASLGALLQLSLGLTAWKRYGPDRWAVRANPSSGNLHPTEAYLLIAGIDALQDGLYHYRPENHALELRAAHPTAGREPSLAILLSSVMWREAWKYGERAFRYCQLDTGHAAGALRYAAAALGWRLAEQAHVGSDTLARLAGIDRLAEFPARKCAETELEEAEILLAASFCAAAPAALESTALQALAEHSTWHGVASTIDRHPMYSWPAIAQVAAATRRADGPAQPAAALPAAAPRAPGEAAKPVQALLGERRSAQRFDRHHVMSQAQFAAILARLQPEAGLPWDVFAEAPRMALVLFVARVEGLTPGLYLLPRSEAQRDALRPLLAGRFALAPLPGLEPLLQLASLEPLELQRATRSLHCHQDIASTACFALGMLAEFDAALAAGPAAYRSLYREAGLIGQALYLEAEAQGLRGTGIGCFFDDPVHALLGLDGSAWQTLYHFTVGLPVEDPRIESAPAYADDHDTLPH
ncbi:SagB family peptide dehydrogenase [Azotobacter chroococcum]|uniref:SagB family peptide dehydrogenase n=1 Tax=Azotobacter chroococcum TaxID=353 RepID=UPI0010ADD8CA|nr:SagB family peptide dehydrogenase [Azotobacter chroococcum]TKD43544.1 SagB/ThcOx family dehydrogenase [Azotobacter chroococcum]